jgi:hypothetical protein
VQGIASGAAALEDNGVNDEIDSDHQRSQHQLNVVSEPRGIEHRKNVVLDETSLISGKPGSPPKRILQRGQGTDAASELDERSPRHCRQVQVDHLPPAQYQQPAEDDEEHEEGVDEDDEIGEHVDQKRERE